MFTLSKKRSTPGDGGIAVLIIPLIIIGIGFWWLVQHKKSTEADGKNFARMTAETLAVRHDPNFLNANLGRDARLQFPPSKQSEIVNMLLQLGVPMQPIKVEGQVIFQSYFFEPHGQFTAELNYAARRGHLTLEISRPAGRWLIDNIGVSADRER